MGLLAGFVCFNATNFIKRKLEIDDSLDVFPVHGVGGTLDTLIAEVFVSTESGVFSGQGFAADINSIGEQLSVQFIGVLATVVFIAVVTWILLKLTDALVGLRLMKIQRWKVWISVLMKNEATTLLTELLPPWVQPSNSFSASSMLSGSSGRNSVKVEPLSIWLRTSTRPLRKWVVNRTSAKPNPVPA